MNLELVEKIANAVLYEGYILYPYRPSSTKNRQRWTFGGLYPRPYVDAQKSAAGTTDLWRMQAECPVVGSLSTTVDIKLRFLQLTERQIREVLEPGADLPAEMDEATRPAHSLQVDDRLFQSWQEAVERAVTCTELRLADLLETPYQLDFSFEGSRSVQTLHNSGGQLVGVIDRTQRPVEGSIGVQAKPVRDGLYKLTIQITNGSPWEGVDREEALLRSLVSTHAILAVREGEFVSPLDTAEEYKEIIADCSNLGVWPVLVGEEGECDTILASPIILYDYPQIAPESPGDLFDGTEIDEILILRIMTMTEEEKREMRSVDDYARALLARTEALSSEQMIALHGTVRSMRVLPQDSLSVDNRVESINERMGDDDSNG